MKTKKITAILLSAFLALALTACRTGGMQPSMGEKETMKPMESSESADSMEERKGAEQAENMDADRMNAEEMAQFPAFEGMDLEGNAVKSEELFGGNGATVVNFWFTACNPCVGELSELDALNRELSEKGAALIGINAYTIGGDENAIADAKAVLAKKGATYQNVYFDEDSEAGRFAAGVYAFPTTYVVDRKGNIVGEPIVGALTDPKQGEKVRQLVDQALETEKETMN